MRGSQARLGRSAGAAGRSMALLGAALLGTALAACSQETATSTDNPDAAASVDAAPDGSGDAQASDGGPSQALVLAPQATLTVDVPVGFRLESDAQTGLLQLLRQGEAAPRAVWEVGRWQIGTVPAYNPEANYNPTNLKDNPPEGLRWWQVSKAELVQVPAALRGPQAQVAWRLQTSEAATGQAGPAWLLLIAAEPKIGFALQLRGWDEQQAKAWHKDQGSDLPMYLRLEHRAPQDEGYYGIGEMFDTPQHRGKVRALQLEGDFNLDGSSNEGHVRIPLLTGTRGWGWFAETRRAGVVDVAASDPQRVAVILNGSAVDLHLLAADKPLDVIGAYWRRTGAPALPAAWALGGLMWRNENKDQAEVLQDAADLRKHDLAISGLWIDRPFDSAVNDFGFSPAMFPDPKGMIAQLHDQGLRLGVWSTPYLDPGYDGKPKAKHHDLAKNSGWYVQGPGAWSTILKWGPPIDFTVPAAAAFWRSLVQQYADLGIEGYKLDFAEEVVLGILHVRLPWLFADGSDERTMHHSYQLGYHAAYAEKLPKHNGLSGGGWILARNSTWGDQTQSSIIWPGDLCAGWVNHGDCSPGGKCHAGGLPSSLAAAISLPTAGFPLFGADTGGYRHGRAPKELFLRWLQHTALTAVLQIGGGSNHHPWISEPVKNELAPGSAFDAETLSSARALIRLHARLFPLWWTELLKAHQQFLGTGPLRPLGLAYPLLAGDPGLRAHEADQHLVGDHLLVAPVITPGTERQVWFPPGQWRDWFDGSLYDGGAAGKLETVQAPLTKLPLYVRAGALVPLLRPTIDTLAPTKAKDVDSFANDRGVLWIEARGKLIDQSAQLWDGSKLSAVLSSASSLDLVHVAGSEFKQGARWLLRDQPKAPAVVKLLGAQAVEMAKTVDELDSCQGLCWHHDAASQVLQIRAPAGDVQVQGL